MINLYDKSTTNFTNNGIVVLSDCISCYNEEKLNDIFECTLTYPIDSRGKWQYLLEGNIIRSDGQLFRIYHKIKTLSGIQISARHIFYDLLDNFLEDVRPTNLNGSGALNWILSHTQYPNIFTSMSDISKVNTQYFVRINPVDAIMGKTGIIAGWGGELVRDNLSINLMQARGLDRGVLISYGKNIIGITETLDMDTVCTRLMPVGANGLLLTEKYIDSPLINNYVHPYVRTMNFPNAATEADLLTAGNAYMATGIDKPLSNYVITFLELTKTEEYKMYSVLESVYMGDTVTVRHTVLQMDLKCEVIRIKKNILTGRIEEVELGNFKPNLATTLNSYSSAVNAINNITDGNGNLSPSAITAAIQNATNLLISSNDGHVLQDVNGINIMDTTDKNTAVKVWRFNLNGLGYSSTGYNGPYGIAITADGHIVADYITSGILDASLLKIGTIASTDGSFSFGISSGTMTINNSSGGTVLQEGKIKIPSFATFNRATDQAINEDFSLANNNSPRYYAGKFGKGLLIEEASTNMITYGNMEATTPKLNNNSSPTGCTTGFTSTFHKFGANGMYINKTAAASSDYQMGAFSSLNGCVTGQTYTFSAWIYVQSGQGWNLNDIYLEFFVHLGSTYYSFKSSMTTPYNVGNSLTAFDTWQKLIVTYKVDVGADQAFVRITEANTGSANGKNYIVDACMFENKSYDTTFHDVPRLQETLDINNNNVLNSTQGTVEFVVTPNTTGITDKNDFTWGNSGTDGFLMRRNTQFNVEYYNAGVTTELYYNIAPQKGVHYKILFRWSSTGCDLFVDNIKRASSVNIFSAPSASTAQIGYRSGYTQGDAIYEDLRISSRTRTDSEIAGYNINIPLPEDAYTTCYLGLNGTLAYNYYDFGILATGGGNNISLTDKGLEVSHSDGSYTLIDADGFNRYVAGTATEYHYLTYVGYATANSQSNCIVQIPDEFIGKKATVSFSIKSINCVTINSTLGYLMGIGVYGAVSTTGQFGGYNCAISAYPYAAQDDPSGKSLSSTLSVQFSYVVIA